MRICESRDLRQVRHTDHLVILCQHPQLRAHNLPALPADTRVDLVKNQRRRRISRGQDRLQCQHQA